MIRNFLILISLSLAACAPKASEETKTSSVDSTAIKDSLQKVKVLEKAEATKKLQLADINALKTAHDTKKASLTSKSASLEGFEKADLYLDGEQLLIAELTQGEKAYNFYFQGNELFYAEEIQGEQSTGLFLLGSQVLDKQEGLDENFLINTAKAIVAAK